MDRPAYCESCSILTNTIGKLNHIIDSKEGLGLNHRCSQLEKENERLRERVAEQQSQLERLHQNGTGAGRLHKGPPKRHADGNSIQLTLPNPTSGAMTPSGFEVTSLREGTPESWHEYSHDLQLSPSDIIRDDSTDSDIEGDVTAWIQEHDADIRGTYNYDGGPEMTIAFPVEVVRHQLQDLVTCAVEFRGTELSQWSTKCIYSARYHNRTIFHEDEEDRISHTACKGCTTAQRLCGFREGSLLKVRALHRSFRKGIPSSASFWVLDSKPEPARLSRFL